MLREVSPEHTHYLFCLSDSDQENIIAAVVGRKLGFERIVVHIRDPDYGPICEELDIDDVINPDQEVGRALADIVEGEQSTDYRGLLHEGVRFFSFVATEGEAGPLGALQLPEGARVIAVSRDDKSRLADPETEVKEGDEILLIADQAQIKTLRERFHPPKN